MIVMFDCVNFAAESAAGTKEEFERILSPTPLLR